MDWGLFLGENQTFPQTLYDCKIHDLVLTYPNLYSPACLLSLATCVCLGLARGAEISAGSSPLALETCLGENVARCL